MNDLETRIHSLIVNELDEPSRSETLERIAQDEAARTVLVEMLEIQRLARLACGVETPQARMAEHLAQTKKALGIGNTADSSTDWVVGKFTAPTARRTGHRRFVWLYRGAAAAVLAISMYVGITAHLANRATMERLAGLDARITDTAITPREMDSYRQIWNQIVLPAETARPWVLLKNGNGRFEYPSGPASGQLVMLRCSVVSSDGHVIQQINMLIPGQRSIELSPTDAGQLAGQPLWCNFKSQDRWVGVDLKVGGDAASSVGVQGRIAIGNSPEEIGQFRLGKDNLKVFLQALPLS